MDIDTIKRDFPIFTNHPDLVYLDSTATSLKPQSVIDAEMDYYSSYSANVHRGIYQLAEQATAAYEATRDTVAAFIGASSSAEILFTRGTTESVNLIASTLGEQIVQSGDTVIATTMEHHSNFVPWQQLALRKQANWQVLDFDEHGFLDLSRLPELITEKTKIVAFTAVSNTLGTINPVKEIVQKVRALNPKTIIVVDAAQAVPHTQVNVQDWGADFVAFSGHKMLGPTGVGVLWGKEEHLDRMPPYQFGGEMVLDVSVQETTFKELPHKFEAGTPNIAGVIALKAAIEYLQHIGLGAIQGHERDLRTYAIEQLRSAFGAEIQLLGDTEPEKRCGILSFAFQKYHAHDIAQILDQSHVAVRAGHHCTMPLHKKLGLSATARASFYLYNTKADVDALVTGLMNVKTTLS